MNVPVIFIHQGNNDYLNIALKKAKQFNEEVILIGNESHNFNNFFNSGYFYDGCDTFRRDYVHLSTNPFEYELFCIQRWFILKNFMDSNNIQNCFYLDSDVMLYQDVSKDFENYKQFLMSIVFGTCAVVSYISLESIHLICEYITKLYSNKNSPEFKELQNWFDTRKSCGLHGGVCDMTLFKKFAYQFPNAIGELTHNINDSVYDHCINQKDYYYEYINGFKNIKFVDNQPLCLNEKAGVYVRFKSLHFQGGSKSKMSSYA